eukprot:4854658-Pyramimonas_sp.AAC.1
MADVSRIPRPKISGQVQLGGVKTFVVHKLLRHNKAQHTRAVSANAVGKEFGDAAEPHALHPAALSPDNLSKICSWRRSNSEFFEVRLPEHIMSQIPVEEMEMFGMAIHALLKYPNGCNREQVVPEHPLGPNQELMHALCKLGLWEGPPYKITVMGKALLEVGIGLNCPSPLLMPHKRTDDIDEATLAQLI